MGNRRGKLQLCFGSPEAKLQYLVGLGLSEFTSFGHANRLFYSRADIKWGKTREVVEEKEHPTETMDIEHGLSAGRSLRETSVSRRMFET
jgi:hypothetical protein